MKKILLCIFSVLLIFGLTACDSISMDDVENVIGLFTEEDSEDKDDEKDGKEDKDKDKEKESGDISFSQDDVQSWISGLLNSMENEETGDLSEGIFGGMDFDELPSDMQAQVKEELKQEGVEIKTNADGTTTYVDADGSEITQNKDGTWVVTNADGSTGQLGGDWPSNEFTKQVPKPSFGLTAASTDEYSFSVAFIGVGIDDLRDYVDELKDEGFTENVENEDTSVFGIEMFMYAASNGKGYRVEVTSAMGVCGMTIMKE